MSLLNMLAVAFIATFCAAGCALFGPNPQMNADQLKAAASDNKNVAICNSFPIMGGVAKIVILSEDQTRNINGVITVEGNCDKITLSTDTVQQPLKVPVNRTVVSP